MSGKRYSEIEIEKALVAAATLGIRPAARELNIPFSTIQQWTYSQAERYAEIRTQHAPQWRERAAAQFEDVVDRLTELEHAGADKLTANIDRLEAKDLARTIKDLSTAKGINTQHVNSLRGQPTQVVEHKYSVTQIDTVLERLLKEAAVETTATEVETPELPPAA